MPNYGYHFARAQGSFVRAVYLAALPLIGRTKVQPKENIELDVYSYSSESALPEQIASIRSFLRHVGRPTRFTVVSDGTHSRRSVERLRQLDSSIAVAEASDWIPRDVPRAMLGYLTGHPTGRQLALVMSLPRERPALYLDSDVLFFPGANAIAQLSNNAKTPAFYLADCNLSADRRLFHDDDERARPVNTGVLLLVAPLDWSLAVRRFLELTGEPIFFTNQTLTHLAMHANGASSFDPAKYVLQLDDQFVHEDRYAGPGIVLRHYVNPVRHKFWTSLHKS